MSDTPETDAYVAKLAHDWVLDFGAFDLLLACTRGFERERDEARATVWRLRKQRVIARNFGEQMERERDEARIQYRSTEALAMALVKTIDELKTEKAELAVKLVNLQASSRRATLDEIAESVRDKYDERHEAEGIDNE